MAMTTTTNPVGSANDAPTVVARMRALLADAQAHQPNWKRMVARYEALRDLNAEELAYADRVGEFVAMMEDEAARDNGVPVAYEIDGRPCSREELVAHYTQDVVGTIRNNKEFQFDSIDSVYCRYGPDTGNSDFVHADRAEETGNFDTENLAQATITGITMRDIAERLYRCDWPRAAGTPAPSRDAPQLVALEIIHNSAPDSVADFAVLGTALSVMIDRIFVVKLIISTQSQSIRNLPSAMPHLRKLWIRDSPNLQFVFPVDSDPRMPYLFTLQCTNCPLLTNLNQDHPGDLWLEPPYARIMPALRRLRLSNCASFTVRCNNFRAPFPELYSLWFSYCPRLTSEYPGETPFHFLQDYTAFMTTPDPDHPTLQGGDRLQHAWKCNYDPNYHGTDVADARGYLNHVDIPAADELQYDRDDLEATHYLFSEELIEQSPKLRHIYLNAITSLRYYAPLPGRVLVRCEENKRNADMCRRYSDVFVRHLVHVTQNNHVQLLERGFNGAAIVPDDISVVSSYVQRLFIKWYQPCAEDYYLRRQQRQNLLLLATISRHEHNRRMKTRRERLAQNLPPEPEPHYMPPEIFRYVKEEYDLGNCVCVG